MHLCHRIRQARLEAKLSQSQLAEKTGVHRSAVAQWERSGGSRPTVDRLAQIATLTGVSYEWLATGRGERRLVDIHGGEHGSALMLDLYAQCELEERALKAFRELRIDVQIAQVEYLEAIAGKGRSANRKAANGDG